MMQEMRILYKVTFKRNLKLIPLYVNTKLNPADWWSRRWDTSDWSLTFQVVVQVPAKNLVRALKHRLVRNSIKQAIREVLLALPTRKFFGRRMAKKVGGKALRQPTMGLAPLLVVLSKIQTDNPEEILVIFPVWKAQPWCWDLLSRSQEAIIFASSNLAFLPGAGGSAEPLGNTGWRFAAAKILWGGITNPFVE